MPRLGNIPLKLCKTKEGKTSSQSGARREVQGEADQERVLTFIPRVREEESRGCWVGCLCIRAGAMLIAEKGKALKTGMGTCRRRQAAAAAAG